MTKIEQVAEAMLVAFRDGHVKANKLAPYVSGQIDSALIDGPVDLRIIARAAIAAIREPSEEMVRSVDAVKDIGDYDAFLPTDARDIWQAMIDAALTEKPE